MRSAQGTCSSSSRSSMRLPLDEPGGMRTEVRGKPPKGVDVAEGTPGYGVAQGGRWRIPYRITRRYASTMTQVVARLDDELIAAVDRLVKEGIFESRSDAVRRGLHLIVDRQRRQRIGDAIVEGYRRIPETEEEIRWADAATIAMIEDEPW